MGDDPAATSQASADVDLDFDVKFTLDDPSKKTPPASAVPKPASGGGVTGLLSRFSIRAPASGGAPGSGDDSQPALMKALAAARGSLFLGGATPAPSSGPHVPPQARGSLFLGTAAPITEHAAPRRKLSEAEHQTEMKKLELLEYYNHFKGDHLDEIRGLETEWADRLRYAVKSVREQVRAGQRSARVLEHFFERYVRLQNEFGKGLMKLWDEELKRLHEPDQPGEGFSTLDTVVISTIESARELGQAHLQHASDMESFVHMKLRTMAEEHQVRLREALSDQAKASEEIKVATTGLEKAKNRAMKYLTALEEVKSGAPPSSSSGWFESSGFKIAGSDPAERAYEACLDYDHQLNETQRAVDDAATRIAPKILQDFQEVEQLRFAWTSKVLDDYQTSIDLVQKEYHRIFEKMKGKHGQLSLKKDLRNVVAQCYVEDGKSLYSYKYELPLALKDLRNFVTDFSQRRKFGIGVFPESSLERTMRRQMRVCPTVELPEQFIHLLKKFYVLGGTRTEGIFRVAPNLKALDQYIEQIKDREWDAPDLKDAHVPATALKFWLRSLSHPLIPLQKYSECVEAMNSESSGTKYSASWLVSFIEALPPAQKFLIKALCALAQEISSETNVRITKMSVSNLAIIFAPIILRKTEGSLDSASGSPEAAADSTKHEINFVVALFSDLHVLPADASSFDDMIEKLTVAAKNPISRKDTRKDSEVQKVAEEVPEVKVMEAIAEDAEEPASPKSPVPVASPEEDGVMIPSPKKDLHSVPI